MPGRGLAMLGYVTIGANDLDRSERFYSALLVPLGYARARHDDGIAYTLADGSAVYVKKPFDGRDATAGNGTMLAFRVPDQTTLRALHGAGLAAGGTDEGAPGFRAQYSPDFCVGYLRDPLGNKLALYCTVG